MLASASIGAAHGWGEEGHSIVAEIAQRRLDVRATALVHELLGPNTSLASVAGWADDVRSRHPETARWHFVDIPRDSNTFDPNRDCLASAAGDCIVGELERVRHTLACSTDRDARRDALRYAVHLVGDIHQPLHAIDELRGGSRFKVQGEIHGATCRERCRLGEPDSSNLHALWDTTLIRRTVYDWGAYVDRLEQSELNMNLARSYVEAETPRDWALQSHAVARLIWNDELVPADGTLNETYYDIVLPILDQQLALGGLRLAQFLNDAAAGCAENLGRPGNETHGGEPAIPATAAIAYLRQRAATVVKPAIVLNVNVLSPRQSRVNRVSRWILDEARTVGVAVFFITDRTESDRTRTEKSLERAALRGWTQLIMRPAGEAPPPSSADFEAPQRAGIVLRGYSIVLNVSERAEDLAGGYAEKAVLLSNSFPER